MRGPQVPNQGLKGNGGITVYYIAPSNKQANVTAFRPGFRMLVGDASGKSKRPAWKMCYRCMKVSGDNNNINHGSPDAQKLPTTT